MGKRANIKVFYDGGCRVCDSEISVYRQIRGDAGLEFIDISEPGFEAEKYGKSRDDFMQALHVQDEEGAFHVGVDAFRLLWKALPGVHYQLLARLVELPGLHQLAEVGYDLFARNRHRLPRRKTKKGTE